MTKLAEQVPEPIGQDSPPSELFVPAAKRANYCLSGTNNGGLAVTVCGKKPQTVA